MTDPKHLTKLEAMLAMWNEPESARVRTHVDSLFTEDVIFIDPTHSIVGHDAFEAMVHKVQSEIPGAAYTRASAVDSHHGLHRYHWEIHQEGKRLLEGFDVTEIEEGGRISRVEGFFGPLARG